MDDGIEPQRTHDELMRVVVTRGEELRMRRRRAMSLGAGGAVLLLALVTGVLTASQRDSDTRVSAISSGPTTTTPSSLGALDGSGPRGPLDFPLPPFIRPTTTVVRAAVDSAPPRAGTPGGLPAAPPAVPAPPVAGAAPPTTAAPLNPPPLRECTRNQLLVDAVTDKSLYLTGDKVVLTSTVRNRSAEECGYTGYSFESVFTDGNGKAMTLKSVLVADTFRLEPLSPGETLTQTREWDQQACDYADDGGSTCAPAGPGTYRGSVRWSLPGGPYEATAGFGLARLPITLD